MRTKSAVSINRNIMWFFSRRERNLTQENIYQMGEYKACTGIDKFPLTLKTNILACLSLKPWPNGPPRSRRWTQVELAFWLALSGQTDSQDSSQVHASRSKKKNILRQCILYFIGLQQVNGRHSTYVDLRCVAKRLKACFDLRATLISTKVSESQRKSTQGLAKTE